MNKESRIRIFLERESRKYVGMVKKRKGGARKTLVTAEEKIKKKERKEKKLRGKKIGEKRKEIKIKKKRGN